jgi:hypothetical protein
MEQKTRMAYTHRAKQCLITSNLANLTVRLFHFYTAHIHQFFFKVRRSIKLPTLTLSTGKHVEKVGLHIDPLFHTRGIPSE